MIRRIDLRGASPSADAAADYRAVVPRADFDVEAAVPAVHEICEAVRTRGLGAIREYSERFDGVTVDDIRVPAAAPGEALERLDPDVRAGLEESIRRLRATCAAELEADVTTDLAPVPGSSTARCPWAGWASTCPAASRRWSPAS